jgi:hypothetical protein
LIPFFRSVGPEYLNWSQYASISYRSERRRSQYNREKLFNDG